MRVQAAPKGGRGRGRFGAPTLVVLLLPALALLLLALVYWAEQVFLAPGPLGLVFRIVAVPVWVVIVVGVPPAIPAYLLARRFPNLALGVYYVGLLAWGTYWLLPKVAERWPAFLRFVEEFGAV